MVLNLEDNNASPNYSTTYGNRRMPYGVMA